MSREAIRLMVRRAKKDRDFLILLVSDPVKAAEGYDLTEEELQALKSNTPEALVKLIQQEIPHDGGCHGAGTCDHTCGSTCDVTFTTNVGDPVTLTEGFTLP